MPEDVLDGPPDLIERRYGADHGFEQGTLFSGMMIGKKNKGPLKQHPYFGPYMAGACYFSEVTHRHKWMSEGRTIYMHLVHPNIKQRSNIRQHVVRLNGGETEFIPGHCALFMKTMDPVTPDACYQGIKTLVSGLYEWTKLFGDP
jgi:hypothetical protein